MIIEILYPEVCALFGESGNELLLRQTFPQAQFIKTKLYEQPAFVTQTVALLLMGPMSESTQHHVLHQLRPHKHILWDYIERGGHALFTGNALDILGQTISYELNDESVVMTGLGYFDFECRLEMFNRYNSPVLGRFKDTVIVGHKTQFTRAYPKSEWPCFTINEVGMGFNQDTTCDGIHYKNLIATHTIGPIFILNPLFSEYYLGQLVAEPITLPFRDTLLENYASIRNDITRLYLNHE